MFDNGSFLRRRKRYKRASLNHNMPFANVFAPFTPFWIRKPVPVLPAAMQFSSIHHHSTGHHQHPHHQSFNANCSNFNRDTFNLMNFQRTSVLPEADSDHKAFLKKQFYDSPSIQSIKSELFNNPGASKSLFGRPEEPFLSNNSNSYDDDFNNDNIDVESDSENDQLILKQEMNFSLDRNQRKLEDKDDEELMAKNEEWNRIMKNTMLTNEFKPSFPLSTNLNKSLEISKLSPNPTDLSKNSKKRSTSPQPSAKVLNNNEDLEAQILAKKIYQNNPKDESPFYSETLTEQLSLNLGERKRGKYGNAKGFSIENLIGRIVEDR